MEWSIEQLSSLKILLEVSKSRNFREAASKLQLSQAAVSLKLKALEQAVGRPLFDEVGKRKEPNAFALSLCHDFEFGYAALQQRLAQTTAKDDHAENLKIKMAARPEIIEAIADHLTFAGQLEIHACPASEALKLLKEKKIDVAIGYEKIDSPDFMAFPLMNSNVRFVIAKSLIPKGKKLEEIYDKPNFLKGIGYLQYRNSHLIEPWFERIKLESIRPRKTLVMEDWRALLRFVELGFGFSIMPSYLKLDETQVSFVDIPSKLIPGLRFYALFRKNLLAISPIADFLRSLRTRHAT